MTRHRQPYRRYGPDLGPVIALGYEIEMSGDPEGLIEFVRGHTAAEQKRPRSGMAITALSDDFSLNVIADPWCPRDECFLLPEKDAVACHPSMLSQPRREQKILEALGSSRGPDAACPPVNSLFSPKKRDDRTEERIRRATEVLESQRAGGSIGFHEMTRK